MDKIEDLMLKIEDLERENMRLKEERFVSSDEAEDIEDEVQFKTIFESSRLGNKIIASDFTILHVNHALTLMLGYSKKEMVGSCILDYSPPEHHAHWQALQENLWKKSTPAFNLETCLRKKDGSLIWCSITSILFDGKGETLGYTIIEDITKRHNIELIKEEFIAVASHELKTPVSTLKAGIQLLNRMLKADHSTNDRMMNTGQMLEEKIRKLSTLINDLLDFSKMEHGQLNIHKSWFIFSDILENCCDHFGKDATHKIEYKGDFSVKIYADATKITQVLVNFVNNAIKYSASPAEIFIEVKQLSSKILVSVTDHGNGISPEGIPHLFERYYQVNDKGNYESGLGLGLYITGEIIRMHQGEIGVQSEPGKGSTFWFTLPA